MKQVYILTGVLMALLLVFVLTKPTEGSFLDPNTQNATTKIKASDFSLTDMNGKTVRLSDHKGKVVILNFWATWCGPCVKEIPDLIGLQHRYQNKIQVIGVSVDMNGFEDVAPFIQQKQFSLNYPVIVANHPMLEAYKNPSFLPTTFVIDPKGFLRKESVGVINVPKISQEIDDLIDEEG
ncbi:MAG: TlpA family protein disulfide reductase [Bacteroidetes Order II. Incertae sedis bacterium]|nr:TlpA family protein disulfide reductase [Bacteroidetes Order II. bacterium]